MKWMTVSLNWNGWKIIRKKQLFSLLYFLFLFLFSHRIGFCVRIWPRNLDLKGLSSGILMTVLYLPLGFSVFLAESKGFWDFYVGKYTLVAGDGGGSSEFGVPLRVRFCPVPFHFLDPILIDPCWSQIQIWPSFSLWMMSTDKMKPAYIRTLLASFLMPQIMSNHSARYWNMS